MRQLIQTREDSQPTGKAAGLEHICSKSTVRRARSQTCVLPKPVLKLPFTDADWETGTRLRFSHLVFYLNLKQPLWLPVLLLSLQPYRWSFLALRRFTSKLSVLQMLSDSTRPKFEAHLFILQHSMSFGCITLDDFFHRK